METPRDIARLMYEDDQESSSYSNISTIAELLEEEEQSLDPSQTVDEYKQFGDIASAQNQAVRGGEFASFKVNPSGLSLIAHTRGDDASEETKQQAIAEFKKIVADCVAQNKDDVIETYDYGDGRKQYCFVTLFKENNKPIAANAIIAVTNDPEGYFEVINNLDAVKQVKEIDVPVEGQPESTEASDPDLISGPKADAVKMKDGSVVDLRSGNLPAGYNDDNVAEVGSLDKDGNFVPHKAGTEKSESEKPESSDASTAYWSYNPQKKQVEWFDAEHPEKPRDPTPEEVKRSAGVTLLRAKYPGVKAALQAAHKKFFDYYNTAKVAADDTLPGKEKILSNIYNIHKEYKKIADAYPSIHPQTQNSKINKPAEPTKPDEPIDEMAQAVKQVEESEKPQTASGASDSAPDVRNSGSGNLVGRKQDTSPPTRSNSIISRLIALAKNPKNKKLVEKLASRMPSVVEKINIKAGRHPEFLKWFSDNYHFDSKHNVVPGPRNTNIKVSKHAATPPESIAFTNDTIREIDPKVADAIIAEWLKHKRSSQV